ncbi:hypothetical protein C8D87_11582 [Lentzea atacamensis]|uniref:Uncharacterized protein n=1 Tax=Lentzea atacamensis TaxID=531938 RepID=A0ABX9DXR7_9PSEU|nr:hypothetical protein C8D87_11582 [Lentzea atacamensis]
MVVGVFPHHRVAYLRRELGALQRLVRKRLDTMPMRQPFDGVELEISAQLPDDPRLLALLEYCNDSDPDWLVQWWEADPWRELDAHADVALSEVLTADTEDGWGELHGPDQLAAVVESVGALSVVAEQRFGGPGDADLRPRLGQRMAAARVMVACPVSQLGIARSTASATALKLGTCAGTGGVIQRRRCRPKVLGGRSIDRPDRMWSTPRTANSGSVGPMCGAVMKVQRTA